MTLGVLLAAITPSSWLKVGILLVAGADVWLVAAHLLQAPNAKLGAAAPPASLPQLHERVFGSAIMGYGDLFIAAVLGAVLADRLRVQLSAALLTLVLASLFGLLFFFLNSLPATVPVAVAMICVELWDWRRRRTVARRNYCSSPPVEAGGRDSSASEVTARHYPTAAQSEGARSPLLKAHTRSNAASPTPIPSTHARGPIIKQLAPCAARTCCRLTGRYAPS